MENELIPSGLGGRPGLLALPAEIMNEMAAFLVKRSLTDFFKFYNYTADEVDKLRRAHPELDLKLRYITYRAFTNDDSIAFGVYAKGKDLEMLPNLSIQSCLRRRGMSKAMADRRYRGIFDVRCRFNHKMALHITGLQAACIIGNHHHVRILLGLGANPNTMCDVSSLVLALDGTAHQPRGVLLRAMAQDGGWMVNCAFLMLMFGDGANSLLVPLMQKYGCVPLATRGASFFNTIGGTVIDEAAHGTACECESGMNMANLSSYRLPARARLDHVEFGDMGLPRLLLHNILASTGDFESLQKLAANKPARYFDTIDATGRPALYWAIHAPEEYVEQTLGVLLSAGVDVNYTETGSTRDCGETALHWICKRSDISAELRQAIIQKLMMYGADPVAPGRPGPSHAPDAFFVPVDALIFPRSIPTWKCQFHSILSHEGFRCIEAFDLLWNAIERPELGFNETLFISVTMRAVALAAPVHSCVPAQQVTGAATPDAIPRDCLGVEATLPERQLMANVAECQADMEAGELYLAQFTHSFKQYMQKSQWDFVDAQVRRLHPDDVWKNNVSPFYLDFFGMSDIVD